MKYYFIMLVLLLQCVTINSSSFQDEQKIKSEWINTFKHSLSKKQYSEDEINFLIRSFEEKVNSEYGSFLSLEEMSKKNSMKTSIKMLQFFYQIAYESIEKKHQSQSETND